FFLSFIAGSRDNSTNGVVAVQRFVDKNNDIQRNTDVRGTANAPVVKYAEDPILPDSLYLVDKGVKGQFKDKPWIAADVGGRKWNNSKKTCDLLSWTRGRTDVTDVSETGLSPFSVYVSYANFTGQGQNQHPQVLVAV